MRSFEAPSIGTIIPNTDLNGTIGSKEIKTGNSIDGQNKLHLKEHTKEFDLLWSHSIQI